MTRAPRGVARRYARALFEVASGSGRETALALRDELRAFVPQLASHPQLASALAHPGVGAERKKRVIVALAERAKASPLAKKLLELLAARDRLTLAGEVAEAYAQLANEACGIVAAEVVSARPLEAKQKQALALALGGGASDVELRERVDPTLLGGLVVSAAGRTYDGSVRTRLAALRRRLAAG